MTDETVTGEIKRIFRHEKGRYGILIDDYWYNGFDLPEDIAEGLVAEIRFYRQDFEGKEQRRVSAIHPVIQGGQTLKAVDDRPAADDAAVQCPKCKADLRLTAA